LSDICEFTTPVYERLPAEPGDVAGRWRETTARCSLPLGHADDQQKHEVIMPDGKYRWITGRAPKPAVEPLPTEQGFYLVGGDTPWVIFRGPVGWQPDPQGGIYSEQFLSQVPRPFVRLIPEPKQLMELTGNVVAMDTDPAIIRTQATVAQARALADHQEAMAETMQRVFIDSAGINRQGKLWVATQVNEGGGFRAEVRSIDAEGKWS
jgi:hypothetical protein